MENNEPKFVSLVSDTTFKYLWKNERTNSWIREIVEAKTGIDLSDYHLSDNEMNTGSLVKDYRTDITLSNNKDNVIIEMNNDYYESAEIKGRQYLFRKAGFSFDSSEKYNEIRTTTLIMFNNYLKKGFEEQAIINSWFGAHELGIKYEDIEMFEIFLPIFNKVCYHRSNEIDKRLRLFSCTSYEEMYSIVDKDDPNYFIIEELRRLGMNNKFVDEYDYEFVQKKLMNSIKDEGKRDGFLEGQHNEKLQIAKKMLEKNSDIDFISECTGLSIEELERLGMNNKFVDEYDYEFVQKKLMNSIKDEGEKAGFLKGKQEGEKSKQLEIAKKSLEQGLDINVISTITGLSIGQIKSIII